MNAFVKSLEHDFLVAHKGLSIVVQQLPDPDFAVVKFSDDRVVWVTVDLTRETASSFLQVCPASKARRYIREAKSGEW